MQTKHSRTRRVVSAAAAVLLGGAVAVAVPATAFAAQATIARAGTPSPANLVYFSVINNEAAPLAGWRVDFDLPAGSYPGSPMFNMQITSSGTHHTVRPLAGAAPIAPGSAVNFGLLMVNGGFPAGCLVNLSTPCADTTDVTPPSTPTAFHAQRTGYPQSGIALSWTASTDNVGVVGYEVRQDGGAWGGVSSYTTRFLPPNSNSATYQVRAVDGRGNRSTAATFVLPAA